MGISTPTALLPGIGLMMRTSGLFTAYAMFRVSWVMRSTLTPVQGHLVSSHGRAAAEPSDRAVDAELLEHLLTAAMTSSFACVCCRWGWPVRSS